MKTASGNAAEKSGGQSFSTPRFENRRPIEKEREPEHRSGEDAEADAALSAAGNSANGSASIIITSTAAG